MLLLCLWTIFGFIIDFQMADTVFINQTYHTQVFYALDHIYSFTLYQASATWLEAEGTCRQLGGVLYGHPWMESYIYIKNIALQDPGWSEDNHVWINQAKIANDTTWLSGRGVNCSILPESLAFSIHGVQEGEQCLVLNMSNSVAGDNSFYAAPCDSTFSFLCLQFLGFLTSGLGFDVFPSADLVTHPTPNLNIHHINLLFEECIEELFRNFTCYSGQYDHDFKDCMLSCSDLQSVPATLTLDPVPTNISTIIKTSYKVFISVYAGLFFHGEFPCSVLETTSVNMTTVTGNITTETATTNVSIEDTTTDTATYTSDTTYTADSVTTTDTATSVASTEDTTIDTATYTSETTYTADSVTTTDTATSVASTEDTTTDTATYTSETTHTATSVTTTETATSVASTEDTTTGTATYTEETSYTATAADTATTVVSTEVTDTVTHASDTTYTATIVASTDTVITETSTEDTTTYTSATTYSPTTVATTDTAITDTSTVDTTTTATYTATFTNGTYTASMGVTTDIQTTTPQTTNTSTVDTTITDTSIATDTTTAPRTTNTDTSTVDTTITDTSITTNITTADTTSSPLSSAITPTFTSTSTTTATTSCIPCVCHTSTSTNKTEEQVQEEINTIKQKLTIQTSTLSAYTRQKTSASDTRASSTALGTVGVLILVSTCVIIVLSDLQYFITGFKMIKRTFKHFMK